MFFAFLWHLYLIAYLNENNWQILFELRIAISVFSLFGLINIFSLNVNRKQAYQSKKDFLQKLILFPIILLLPIFFLAPHKALKDLSNGPMSYSGTYEVDRIFSGAVSPSVTKYYLVINKNNNKIMLRINSNYYYLLRKQGSEKKVTIKYLESSKCVLN